MPDRTKTDGALYWRDLGDGKEIVVYAMIFNARLCFSENDFIVNGYCYKSPERAIEAAKVWNGEGDPLDGWHKNPFDGRRREDGDPTKEKSRDVP